MWKVPAVICVLAVALELWRDDYGGAFMFAALFLIIFGLLLTVGEGEE